MYALFVFGVGNVLIWENVLYGIGVSRKFSVLCVCVCVLRGSRNVFDY